MSTQPSQIPVQSCITTVSFPKNWTDFELMLRKYETTMTDLDGLLKWDENEVNNWTVARWMRPGDIIFFYHGVKAKIYTKQRLNESKSRLISTDPIILLLENAYENSIKYGGKIFGCAEVASEVEQSSPEGGHFKSTHYAIIKHFALLKNPISSELFNRYAKIHQNTITPLDGSQFQGIKQIICESNQIPSYLQNAVATTKTFYSITRRNWITISCSPEIRFRDEAQLREYYLNYFLSEIKDPNSPLLLECECFRDGYSTGFADYMVRINGTWTPVEAKLNLACSPKVLIQIEKYQNIDEFSPTKGKHLGTRWQVKRNPDCLLADQTGIYFARDSKLIECSEHDPILRRASLTLEALSNSKYRIGSLVSKTTGYLANNQRWEFSITENILPVDPVSYDLH